MFGMRTVCAYCVAPLAFFPTNRRVSYGTCFVFVEVYVCEAMWGAWLLCIRLPLYACVRAYRRFEGNGEGRVTSGFLDSGWKDRRQRFGIVDTFRATVIFFFECLICRSVMCSGKMVGSGFDLWIGSNFTISVFFLGDDDDFYAVVGWWMLSICKCCMHFSISVTIISAINQ